jgi:chromosome partitioning protein
MVSNTHIIVIGNEKGGAGKTTTSIHLIIYLLKLGFSVASFDADVRQKSLTRYLENRQKYNELNKIYLEMPNHQVFTVSNANNKEIIELEETEHFTNLITEASKNHDFIVIDTPGSNSYISTLAHSHADTIITPINDSFLDLDVLGQIDASNKTIRPSFYSEVIWKQKIVRARRDKKEINWIVLRNRLSNLDANNKRKVGDALKKLSNKVGFKIAEGFKERVIFKELFLSGLTLLDLSEQITEFKMTISHLAAREELKIFLKELKINKLLDKID